MTPSRWFDSILCQEGKQALPAAWRGRESVAASSKQLEWVRLFWASGFGFEECEAWPLVACCGEELVRLDLAATVLRPLNASVDDLALAALAALGVYVAADDACLPDRMVRSSKAS